MMPGYEEIMRKRHLSGLMPGQFLFDYVLKPQSDGSYSPEQMHRLPYDLNDEPLLAAQCVRSRCSSMTATSSTSLL